MLAHCCTFRLQSWTHKSHCDIHFIDLVLQYLPFYSGTLCKTHFLQLLSPSLLLRHIKHFLKMKKVQCWELTFTISSYIFHSCRCVNLQQHSCIMIMLLAPAVSGGTIWKWNALLLFISACPREACGECDSGISCKTANP